MSSFIFPYHYYRSSCPARQSKAACIWSDRYSFREGWIHFLHLFQWIFEALWRSCVWPLIVVVPEHESRMCGRGVCREWCHHPTEQKQTPLRSYDTKSISTHYLQFHTATAAAAAITWSATVTTVCLQPEMLQYICTTDKYCKVVFRYKIQLASYYLWSTVIIDDRYDICPNIVNRE